MNNSRSCQNLKMELDEEFDKVRMMEAHYQGWKTQIVEGCSASQLPAQRLLPVAFGDLLLSVGERLRGRALYGTVCVDAFVKKEGIDSCLEDDDEHAVRLFIHNLVNTCSVNFSESCLAHVLSIFQKGMKVVIKEPHVERDCNGYIIVHADYPADVEMAVPHLEDVYELEKKGNWCFDRGQWHEAIEYYSKCIQEWSAARRAVTLAYSNRAEAWMKLKQFDQALADSNKAEEMEPENLNSLYRKGRALYGSGQYEEACQCLQTALEKCPQQEEIEELLKLSMDEWNQKRLQEFHELSVLLNRDGKSKCGEYVGPIEIRKNPHRPGRGIFLLRDVKVGELLVASNPIAFTFEEEANSCSSVSSNFEDDGTDDDPLEDLLTQVLNVVKRSPTALRQLYSLATSASQADCMEVPSMDVFRSNSIQFPEKRAQESALLDIERIRKIIRFNYFGEMISPWTELLGNCTPQRIIGLWILPSFINHSCIPNAACALVGRTMVVMAVLDLKAGEEVTISYFQTLRPVKQRQEECQALGFYCNCRRCSLESSLQEVLEEIDSEYYMDVNCNQVEKAVKLRANIERRLRSVGTLSQQEIEWVAASYSHGWGREEEGSSRMECNVMANRKVVMEKLHILHSLFNT